MDTNHPLYYHCQHDPIHERYGLLQQRSNSFYIIDSDPELLKKVQLTMMRHELLHFVNIDHFFNFLGKTQKTIDKYQLQSMIDSHANHVKKAAIFKNDEARVEQIQKSINNNNCFLFGMTESTVRSLFVDVNHFRLTDNITKRDEKEKTFNNVLQEKLFLIRRLMYVLKGVFEYVLEFVTLQEKIGDFGLNAFQQHFDICNPNDAIIPVMVEKELEANQIRIRSIKQFYKAIYKHLNRIDFAQSIKEILKEFDSDVNSKKFAAEAIKDYPAFQNTYDMHKIINILQAEISLLMKYYD